MDRLELAKCRSSPTNKHHWMIPMTGAHPVGICKHCGEERQFDNSARSGNWDTAVRTGHIPSVRTGRGLR